MDEKLIRLVPRERYLLTASNVSLTKQSLFAVLFSYTRARARACAFSLPVHQEYIELTYRKNKKNFCALYP